ncbi:DUF3606 domain-containing protein [uncultured Xylophilus sp.]|uniref:DUF3606 domain-containing protein n=1 Tax=uncultured Xylophilus sp. TaxID=296832 RepID=UPI0025D0BA7B|nr:DUF3606 domain-containing protein [uncultured Xylophilus sp.]
MPDDKQQTGGQDRRRINLHEDYEVRDWAHRFGITPEQLRSAVGAVGDQADAVEAHLAQSRRGGD